MKIGIPEGCRCISLVGGGGKTTLMLRMARQLREEGKKVIVMTTTHMLRPDLGEAVSVYPEDLPYDLTEDTESVRHALETKGWVMAGRPDPENPKKMVGVSREFFCLCMAMAQVVLVEADGARRKPAKIPREWEPVIPGETDLTLAVLGLSGLGRKIRDSAYDPELLAAFLGKGVDQVLEPADYAKIAVSDRGLRKSAEGAYQVILNQADTRELVMSGKKIADCLPDGIPCQVVRRRDRVAIILLAAGNSSRFDGNKLLADLGDGQPMIAHALNLLEKLQGTYAAERIVVSQYPEILTMVQARNAESGLNNMWKGVLNDRPDLGITESIRRGILAAGACDGYLFCVGDQPNLTVTTVEGILHSWLEGMCGIVTAWDGKRPGNPKIFSAFYREELLAITGDRGGSQVMRNHPDDVERYRVENLCEMQDIDTVEDLLRNCIDSGHN